MSDSYYSLVALLFLIMLGTIYVFCFTIVDQRRIIEDLSLQVKLEESIMKIQEQNINIDLELTRTNKEGKLPKGWYVVCESYGDSLVNMDNCKVEMIMTGQSKSKVEYARIIYKITRN